MSFFSKLLRQKVMGEQIKPTKLNLLLLFLEYAFKYRSSELMKYSDLTLTPFSNRRIQVVK